MSILAFRITMQSSLDIINQLPVLFPNSDDSYKHNLSQNGTTQILDKMIIELNDLLKQQLPKPENDTRNRSDSNKRKARRDPDSPIPVPPTWPELQETQQRVKDENWRPVVDKWHAKMYFGSEKTKSNMKVFNHSIWDQVFQLLY